LSYTPTLAEDLGRQSRYLDALIDASAMDLPGDVPELLTAMQRRIGQADYQSTLDIVRDYVGEKRFALGVQLIEGRNDALDIARSYAHLAEAALQTLTAATVAEFEKSHGKVPDSELVILALGRLGGEALTHASDLDLILLFTGDHIITGWRSASSHRSACRPLRGRCMKSTRACGPRAPTVCSVLRSKASANISGKMRGHGNIWR